MVTQFVDTYLNNNLVIGGTLFHNRNIHKVTSISPDNITKNQIDHIALNRKWRGLLLDVRNKRGADYTRDYQLVIGNIRLTVAALRKYDKTQQKYYVYRLLNLPTKTKFIESLNTSLHNLSNNAVNN